MSADAGPGWIDEARRLRAGGYSLSQIGKAVGATEGAVYYHLGEGPGSGQRRCTTCGAVFRRRAIQKYCSRKCWNERPVSAETRRRQSVRMRGTRQGKDNPNYKNGKRVGYRDREGERRFQSGQRQCQHPTCTQPAARVLHQHHVVYRQHVRAADGDQWDPRNAIALCIPCHSSHHRRGRVLPVDALRPENREFVRELLGDAADDYLRRYYSFDQERAAA